jgi:hypothetical protein
MDPEHWLYHYIRYNILEKERTRVRKRKGWEGCGTWRICITSDILLQFFHIYFQHGQLWTPGPATYTFKSINLDLSSALTQV